MIFPEYFDSDSDCSESDCSESDFSESDFSDFEISKNHSIEFDYYENESLETYLSKYELRVILKLIMYFIFLSLKFIYMNYNNININDKILEFMIFQFYYILLLTDINIYIY